MRGQFACVASLEVRSRKVVLYGGCALLLSIDHAGGTVAEELGTWAPEQATVLLDVLQKAGLSAQARRVKGGVVVTVPDSEADEANRQLVANMDTIANAARRQKPSPPRGRKPRPVKGADNPAPQNAQQLASERLKRIAVPVALILVAVLVLGTVGRFQPLVAVGLVAVAIYVIGRRAQRRGDGDSGPGRY